MTNSLPTADLPIIFKDNECLVVDKPAGISVHNGEESGDLLNFLARHFGGARLFPVHRLDKETSGVQLFALNAGAAQALAARFQEREVGKLYVGLVRGKLGAAGVTAGGAAGVTALGAAGVADAASGVNGNRSPASGIWTTSLSDKSESRKNPLGLAKDRVAAVTRYRALETPSKYFTMVEFDLETGRQHQIRKHCAAARHALVGDARYGDRAYNERIAGIYGTSRMFLHHRRLEIAGRVFESPVPAEFARLASGNS